MATRAPHTELPTHRVTNQPPPLEEVNLYQLDSALREAVVRAGAGWAEPILAALGERTGSAELQAAADQANRHPPELRTFDRYGQRIDEVEFHPAYHQLMSVGLGAGIHSLPWTAPQAGHTAHAALEYLLVQCEAGVCCPITMTYAAVPTLRRSPGLAAEWLPKLLVADYDSRSLPMQEKRAVTIGMAMTEKQGGSDLRANTTKAQKSGDEEYLLTGHKWFCSAPMSDAFLTIAQTARGPSCFFVPRWLPDGSRNRFFLQRLKEKLGNRSNASSEIEYHNSHGWLVGDEGDGIRTIIEMVHHTRLDTCLAAAGLMRQAFVQAAHHCRFRAAFGKPLAQQPLMQNVLADLALEAQAALLLTLRLARAYDESATDATAAAFARIGVAAGKYWVNKRTPNAVFEALECHGGSGYVEESPLPRLYREAPLNSIWEGSGNVICLDVLRALTRDSDSADVVRAELLAAAALDGRIADAVAAIARLLDQPQLLERQARRLTETIALVLQAGLMAQHAPAADADAFIGARLGGEAGLAYGTLPPDADCRAILLRAWPPLADLL
jgi:putative acyl-CoA dehydrogenase